MVLTTLKLQFKLFAKPLKLSLGLLLLINAAGCVNSPAVNSDDEFIKSIIDYETTLPQTHSNSTDQVFKLPDSVRKTIGERFNKGNRHKNIADLAAWLMAPDGHGLVYDLEANLIPAQAFEQRRGNCLSFTLLLTELATELDVNLRVNQVDLPETWGQDSQKDLIFYRHVNAVFETVYSTQIFDLAIQEYRPGFPQRLITKREASALLFSNIGIEKLKDKKYDSAIHYLSLSASNFPNNPDMWVNLGAAYKQIGQLDLAEKIYLQAFSIGDKNGLAASNLERLYRDQGQNNTAHRFEKLSAKARARNPYHHYYRAEVAYNDKDYRKASKAIKRAIQLHDQDPSFYELSSRIKQVRNKHLSALEDLARAYQLPQKDEERDRYANKIRMVAARAKATQEEKTDQRSQSLPYRPATRYDAKVLEQ